MEDSCHTNTAGGINTLVIRLSPEIEKRLEDLAKKTGRTKTFYARAAITELSKTSKISTWREKAWKAYEPAGAKPFPPKRGDKGDPPPSRKPLFSMAKSGTQEEQVVNVGKTLDSFVIRKDNVSSHKTTQNISPAFALQRRVMISGGLKATSIP
jgi:RHH-type rel operon transcriptional repressor/antitoxin RelB